MTQIIAGISHKGGTGRSVTLANVAFQLHYVENYSVCMVDLDLASPTLGSILEIPGLEFGATETGSKGDPRNIHDVLVGHDDPTPAIVDVKRKAAVVSRRNRASKSFDFVPGWSEGGDWHRHIADLNKSIERLLRNLKESRYDFVILDVRSGLSDVFEALMNNQENVDLLLVHTRWTPQHLSGLASLLASQRVRKFEEYKVRIVRTAYINPESEAVKLTKFAEEQDAQLRLSFGQIDLFDEYLSLNQRPYLGSIPMISRLRWRECLIEEQDDEEGFAAFSSLTKKILQEFQG